VKTALILNPMPVDSRSAADAVVQPNAKPWAMREHFVVPAVRSREVARAQRSVVPHREDALKAFDFSDSLLGVHSVQISNISTAMVKRSGTCHAAPAKAKYQAYHLDMSRLYSECSDPESSDRSLPANRFLREEPEDEEEEDEEEHHNGEEDDDGDEGYSE
jgi:hypothetical protein